MFNGVVNPFIGRSTSSQHHPFDHYVSSSSSPHRYQLLHVMTNQSSSSSFYEYDPFNQTTNYSIEAEKPSLDNNSDGLIIISCHDGNNTSSALVRRERSTNNNHNQWSSDEAVALLRVRSSLENNSFPDLTWEHVSRKHDELGYSRSADLWKQKFEEEEENKHLNSTAAVKISNQQEPVHNLEPGISQRLVEVKQPNEQLLQHKTTSGLIEEISTEAAEAANTHHLREVSEEVVKESSNNNKRKRRREEDVFETLKRCCEAVANKMMAQQEELHKKLIDDITKRDEQEIAREEARRNQELARVREEIETRAHERAEAEKRQAIIVGFLKKFTTCHDDEEQIVNHLSTSQDSVEDEEEETVLTELQNPNSQSSTRRSNHTTDTPKTASEDRRTGLSLSPLLPKSLESEANMIIESTEKGSEDHDGKKRWPRDEVLALISLRCKLMSNNNSDHVGGKGHLWERISRGMLEMGYKRSAKRCKEKWENINKYFRRTRESKKKRSVDSRTCPYFHQLSCLYSEGTRCIAPESGMC